MGARSIQWGSHCKSLLPMAFLLEFSYIIFPYTIEFGVRVVKLTADHGVWKHGYILQTEEFVNTSWVLEVIVAGMTAPL